jgi:hypothetical protein
LTVFNFLARRIASSTFLVYFVHDDSAFAVSFGYTSGVNTVCHLSDCIQTLRHQAAVIAEFVSDLDASIFESAITASLRLGLIIYF